MLRPTPASLTKELPANAGDPALIVWIMSWGGRALLWEPLEFFDGNIFWNRPLTLAYSDLLLPLAPVFWLLRLLTGNVVLAFNLTIVGCALFTQAATFLLARRLTGRADVAVVAALAFSFSAYALAHRGHPQLQTTGFVVLSFFLLFKLMDERGVALAVLTGVVIAAVPLAALYYGVVLAACLVAIVAGYLVSARLRPGPGFGRAIAIAAGTAGVLCAPFALGYLRFQDQTGFERPTVPGWGFKPMDLLTPSYGSYAYDWLQHIGDPRDGEHHLFPGFVVLVLAVVGLVVVLRRRPPARAPHARADRADGLARSLELRLLCLAGVVALLLAFGPDIGPLPGPYRLARAVVPGFEGIRVTARLAVISLLALAVLAAAGLAALLARVARLRTPSLASWLACLALGAIVLAELAAPVPNVPLRMDDEVLEVYRALADRPDGPVVELPLLDPVDGYNWAVYEAPRMVRSTWDWNPRVNGYSGYVPDGYPEDVSLLNTFPSPEALARLEQLGVRWAVLHLSANPGSPLYTEAEAAAIVDALPDGTIAERHGAAWLIDLGSLGAPAR